MKVSKRFLFLPPVALAGLLCAAGVQSAAAAPIPAQIAAAQPQHGLSTPAYYTWHGKHYSYHYKGRYYNHRSWKNGHWWYY